MFTMLEFTDGKVGGLWSPDDDDDDDDNFYDDDDDDEDDENNNSFTSKSLITLF